MKNIKFYNLTKLFFLTITALCVIGSSAGAKSDKDKTIDNINDFINDTTEKVKNEIDDLGDDFSAIQHYLSNYKWKGLIQGNATSEGVNLSQLILNGHPKAVIVKPGDIIEGEVICEFDQNKVANFSLYRIVMGYKGIGPQTTLFNSLGLVTGDKSIEKFVIHAPLDPGMYELRFRTVTKYLEGDALQAWVDERGHEPDASTTIGIIVVKS